MDPAFELFKSGATFQELYKLSNFGKNLLPNNTTQRSQAITKHRRETRGANLLKLRKISISKMSPYITPNKRKIEEKPIIDVNMEKMKQERRERLERYKQIKLLQKKAEKEKKKPPFKVGSAGIPPPPLISRTGGYHFNSTTKFDKTSTTNFNFSRQEKTAIPETKTVRLRNTSKMETNVVVKNKKEVNLKTSKSRKLNSTSSLNSVDGQSSSKQTHKYSTRSQTKATEAKPVSSTKVAKTR